MLHAGGAAGCYQGEGSDVHFVFVRTAQFNFEPYRLQWRGWDERGRREQRAARGLDDLGFAAAEVQSLCR